jgi:hypothetical protein
VGRATSAEMWCGSCVRNQLNEGRHGQGLLRNKRPVIGQISERRSDGRARTKVTTGGQHRHNSAEGVFTAKDCQQLFTVFGVAQIWRRR